MPPDVDVPSLSALGWDEGWATLLDERCGPGFVPGRVSRIDRGMCTVMTATAEVRAGFERGEDIAVGDWVGIDPAPAPVRDWVGIHPAPTPTKDGMGIDPAPAPTKDGVGINPTPRPARRATIAAVLPRRSAFRRQANDPGAAPQIVAANIDTVFLCDALDGTLSLRHLERFLALAWQSGATPVVLITKSDAVPPAAVSQAVEAVEAIAERVNVVVVSSTTGEGLTNLQPYLLEGRTVALLGLSGAGKSTLANLLSGADTQATGPVRRDGSGRHTTTHRELVVLPSGGLLIDTPGMRALSVLSAGEGVEQAFQDVEALSRLCSYPRCSHAGEEGCAIAEAIAEGRLERGRLDGWLRLKAELAPAGPEDARRDVADRKRRTAAKVAQRRADRK